MNTKELLEYVESNGGYNMNRLNGYYQSDIKYHNEKGSFRTWLTAYIKNHESVTYYVARRVAEHLVRN